MDDVVFSAVTRLVTLALTALMAGTCLPACSLVPVAAKQDSPSVQVQQQQQNAPGNVNQQAQPQEPTSTKPTGTTWDRLVDDPLLVAVGAGGTTATVAYAFWRLPHPGTRKA